MSPSLEHRSQVSNAIIAGRVLSLIGLLLALLFVYFDASSVIRQREKLRILVRQAKSRACVWLLLISLLGLWTIILCVLMWWVNWIGRKEACPPLVTPMVPIVYIAMKQCLYMFLFDRAKVVHTALKIDHVLVRGLRWIVFFFSTIGIPLATWWIFFVYWRGRVLVPEGICVQAPESVGGIIAVSTLDFLLSLAMLGLFLAPVVKHMRKIHDDEITPRFHRLVKRNLAVSVTMMVSTLGCLTVMTVEFSIVHSNAHSRATEHLLIWATFFPMFDTILTVVLPHCLTNAWMTPRVRGCCSRLNEEEQGGLVGRQHLAARRFASSNRIRPSPAMFRFTHAAGMDGPMLRKFSPFASSKNKPLKRSPLPMVPPHPPSQPSYPEPADDTFAVSSLDQSLGDKDDNALSIPDEKGIQQLVQQQQERKL